MGIWADAWAEMRQLEIPLELKKQTKHNILVKSGGMFLISGPFYMWRYTFLYSYLHPQGCV